MQEKKVTLINKRGLHARAATRLVQTSQQYLAKTEVCLNERIANARNIMQLLMLAAPCGTELLLRAEGEDEQQAIAALEALVLNRFDEED
ncbi:HPr family phosphocarrier protein [Marinospirillum insulare]|uniref:Phosphocarrier protein HPr n=1 Tax=Marinospirillum insulare TaxID=217169 RepID=A0ABQ5ZSS6_9GAMM|nr:HPr family phosphocarrier protein [Marinospirillum insulare]GLR63186.1 phosphocarrier protein HPr [Marinospirillum insulare]